MLKHRSVREIKKFEVFRVSSLLLFLFGMNAIIAECALAGDTGVKQTQEGAKSSGLSYKERRDPRFSKSGPIDADPNVYVYSSEFAARFQMPDEGVSSELKGVDAVAFRVIPRPYRSCGWGGDPNSCRDNEVLCEMDLYFDHKRNPLPWDWKRPDRYLGYYKTSVNFLSDVKTNLYYERLISPSRKDDHIFAKSSPFIDPKNGKGLWWQGGYWNSNEDRGGMPMSVASFDKEVFSGMALVVMSGSCGQAPDSIWLTGDNAGYKEKDMAFKLISLPQAWRLRIKDLIKESSDRANGFFSKEGEKAIKSLRESPVINRTISPVQ